MRPLADIVYAACFNPDKLIPSHPTPQGRRAIGAALKSQMFGSRRFYVNEEVTRAATSLGVQHPDILMSMLQRARLPFEKVWVEWDNHAQTEEAGGVLAEDAQKRVGCLIEQLQGDEPLYKLTVICQPTEYGDNRVVVSSLSIVYHLSKPLVSAHTQGDQKKISEISKLPADYVRKTLIGGAYREKGLTSTIPIEMIEEIEHRRNLCDNLSNYATWVFSPHMVPIIKDIENSRVYRKDEVSNIIKNDVIEGSGTWRFIVSLFALINARDYVDSEKSHRQGHNRMVSGKIVPYLDHWLVSLKLPRKIVQARLVREFAESIPRRRHEVIGHWKQSNKKGLPDCEHIYVDETPTRQVCIAENCGHKRWWVNNFMRGDASIGIIIKDRLVTK